MTQLEHLAGACFQQDYDLEFGTPEKVIDAFVADEGSAANEELVSEIDQVLASLLSDNELRDFWIGRLSASYDPGDDGLSMRSWLVSVRSRITQ